jgi:hypothetical protein
MKLWRWIWNSVVNLPRNLRTIRPLLVIRWGKPWGLAVRPWVYLDAGDERYILHFNSAGVYLVLGPLYIATGLVDTD